MTEAFRLRIASSSEKTSTDFVPIVLSYLESLQNIRYNAIQLCPEQWNNQFPFEDVRNLDWASSIEKIKTLAKQGFNLIILSERYLDWNTNNKCINDDQKLLDETLESLNMAVISVETFLEEDYEQWLSSIFSRPQEFYKIDIREILQFMLDGFKAYSLLLPYGVLPYFKLHPDFKNYFQNNPEVIKSLVGFQHWQYKKFLKRYPNVTFVTEHMTGRLDGKPVARTGAVPVILTF